MALVRARRIVAKQSAPQRAARSHGVAASGRRPKPRAAPAPLLRRGPASAGRALKPVGGAPPAAALGVPGAPEWRAPDWRPPEGQPPQRRALAASLRVPDRLSFAAQKTRGGCP